jgi:molybdopterin synthase catalytic subunit
LIRARPSQKAGNDSGDLKYAIYIGIMDVQIHHLLGEFNVGEDLVYVLVAGSHRKQVFTVLEEAVERYKKEAPIFKKEHVVTKKGEAKAYWVEEPEERI